MFQQIRDKIKKVVDISKVLWYNSIIKWKDGKQMNILVACEESQRVTEEFRKLGHNAFSCDIIECSGGHPE